MGKAQRFHIQINIIMLEDPTWTSQAALVDYIISLIPNNISRLHR
jgi:hypothetical protein